MNSKQLEDELIKWWSICWYKLFGVYFFINTNKICTMSGMVFFEYIIID